MTFNELSNEQINQAIRELGNAATHVNNGGTLKVAIGLVEELIAETKVYFLCQTRTKKLFLMFMESAINELKFIASERAKPVELTIEKVKRAIAASKIEFGETIGYSSKVCMFDWLLVQFGGDLERVNSTRFAMHFKDGSLVDLRDASWIKGQEWVACYQDKLA